MSSLLASKKRPKIIQDLEGEGEAEDKVSIDENGEIHLDSGTEEVFPDKEIETEKEEA